MKKSTIMIFIWMLTFPFLVNCSKDKFKHNYEEIKKAMSGQDVKDDAGQ